MGKRRSTKTTTAQATPAAPAERRPGLDASVFSALALLGALPLGYFTFARPVLADAHLGPFGLMPLMVWPGLLALFFRGRAGLGWRPPTWTGAAAGLLYPVLVVAVTFGSALVLGLGKLAPEVAGGVFELWGRELGTALSGTLLPVLGEELGWRGFLQQRLEATRHGRWGALLIASAVATAFHAVTLFGEPMRASGAVGVASFLSAVFLLQLAAGSIFTLGGRSVAASFLFHLVWNATNPLFTSDVYGGQPGLLLGAAWQTSGEGVAGIVASVLCLPPLLWLSYGRGAPATRARPSPARYALLALVTATLVLASALSKPNSTMAPLPVAAPESDAQKEPVQRPGAIDGEPAADDAGAASLRTRAEVALSRGLRFLESMLDRVSLDAVFLLRLVEGALPSSPAGRLAARALPAAQRDATYPLFKTIVDKPWTPLPTRPLPALDIEGTPDPAQAFDEKFSDQCLTAALECRWAPGCRAYKEKAGQWGYVLSHQVLFFLFVKTSNCAQKMGVDADAFLSRFGRAMLKEQEADSSWSDLMAERVGLGAHAGFAEFLDARWIETIVNAQQMEGCWWWRPEDPGCNDHASGMAAWVLALWLRAQPPAAAR